MNYLIINLTNYGQGYRTLGTTRSMKKALEIVDELEKHTLYDNENGCQDSWQIIQLENIDKYTTVSLIVDAKNRLMINER